MDETAIFLKYVITPKFTKSLDSLKVSLSEYGISDSSAVVYLAETALFLIALTDMTIADTYSDNDRYAQISDLCNIVEENYSEYFFHHYPNYTVREVFSIRVSLICDALYHNYEPLGRWCLGNFKRPDVGKLDFAIHHLLGDYILHSLIFHSGIVCKPEAAPYATLGADKYVDFFRTYMDNIPKVINNYAENILKVIRPISSKQPTQVHSDIKQQSPSKSASQQYGGTKTKKPKWWIFILGIILFIVVVVIAVTSSSDSESPYRSDDYANSMETATPTPALPPEPVYNGKMFISPTYNCVCPFTVSVAGTDGYYVYLEYRNAPASSTEWRSGNSGQGNIAFYVAPGQTVSIDVPIGVYKLYYACGDTWYGQSNMFGEDTLYYSSDEYLEFYADTQYYNGVTLELWAQYNGNFDTDIINEGEFPS